MARKKRKSKRASRGAVRAGKCPAYSIKSDGADKSADKSYPACGLFKLCEDPKTGRIVAIPQGECPPGFYERTLGKAVAQGGMDFDIFHGKRDTDKDKK